MFHHQQGQIYKKSNKALQKRQQATYRSAFQPNETHPATLIQRAKLNPNSLNADEVLTLQETIGNRAATQLLAGRSGQRVQPKLTIGEPGDKYEQEADRVAAEVVQQMNMPASQQAGQSESVQREEMEDEELMMKPEVNSIQPENSADDSNDQLMPKKEAAIAQREAIPKEEDELMMKPMVQCQPDRGMAATADLEASINQARGSGQPIADNIREPIEQAFGTDFSGVKVHTDAQSDRLNQSIQARAFTTGQDIFFRQGEYNPGSQGGQELIAHELAHVVQQSGGAVQREQLQRVGNGDAENEEPLTVINYNSGLLNRGPFFEHIKFSDGSSWSTKIVSSGQNKGKHVYLDIRQGLHQGERYSVSDEKAYKAQEVKLWLLAKHPDLKDHWKAYREVATKK